MFIYKPTLYIPFKDIETVAFDRVGGAVGVTRSFDLKITMKPLDGDTRREYVFAQIDKEEHAKLSQYLRDKQTIKVRDLHPPTHLPSFHLLKGVFDPHLPTWFIHPPTHPPTHHLQVIDDKPVSQAKIDRMLDEEEEGGEEDDDDEEDEDYKGEDSGSGGSGSDSDGGGSDSSSGAEMVEESDLEEMGGGKKKKKAKALPKKKKKQSKGEESGSGSEDSDASDDDEDGGGGGKKKKRKGGKEAAAKGKKKRAKKDPNAPKKGLSAYMLYAGSVRAEVVEAVRISTHPPTTYLPMNTSSKQQLLRSSLHQPTHPPTHLLHQHRTRASRSRR